MIINNQLLIDKYKCNKHIMEYLVYQCQLPILSFDGDSYYFANTDKLRKCIGSMPLTLKVSSIFKK